MADGLILLVDDEAHILQLARLYLEREGYRVEEAQDGQAAVQAAAQHHPDLIVLDVMLPHLDGFEVCKKIRADGDQTPILMLTAHDEDIDKILGLELGADDYMTKPFNPRELVARVKAVLRRVERPVPGTISTEVRVGDLRIDAARREARCSGRLLDLRTQEFEVLQVLAGDPGRVFTRDQLLNLAWGYDFAGQTRTVDVHIVQLRRKLGNSAVRIETVTGVGYKLVA